MKESLYNPIFSLAQKIVGVREDMERLGLFAQHRDLVSCSGCQLTEDVTFTGYLQVFRGSDINNIVDIVFIEKENDDVICPECGEIVL